jgi:hypothetical protein
MSRCGFVISVRCRNVPAGPAKVPTWMRSSSRRRSGQVSPQAFSAMQARRSASLLVTPKGGLEHRFETTLQPAFALLRPGDSR